MLVSPELRQKLLKAKMELVAQISHGTTQYIEAFDLEQLEYIVQMIDDFILENVPVDSDTISIFIEELVVTSVQQVNPLLLKIVSEFQGMEGDFSWV